MARVWIYDNENTKKYKEAVQRAKKAKRQAPDRWQVLWYSAHPPGGSTAACSTTTSSPDGANHR